MGPDAWLNYRDYELWAIILTAVGGICWIVVYAMLIRIIRSEKYVEMPVVAACGNFAWEFLWGFPFATMVTLGQIFVWSYRIWFILDIYIFYSILKYGVKQISTPEIHKHWPAIGVAIMLGWGVLIYGFVVDGKDLLWGAPSAYILATCISGLIILLFLRQRHQREFSKTIAWFKLIGTTCYSIAYISFQPGEPFLRAICAVVFILDVIYVVMLHRNTVFPPKAQPALAVA